MIEWEKEFNSKFVDWNSPRHFAENKTPDEIIAFFRQKEQEIREEKKGESFRRGYMQGYAEAEARYKIKKTDC